MFMNYSLVSFPAFTAVSGGDMKVDTLDGHTYSFNGHGEYVFLRINATDNTG